MLSVERKERMVIPSLFCDSPKKNNLKINWNRKRDISGSLLFDKNQRQWQCEEVTRNQQRQLYLKSQCSMIFSEFSDMVYSWAWEEGGGIYAWGKLLHEIYLNPSIVISFGQKYNAGGKVSAWHTPDTVPSLTLPGLTFKCCWMCHQIPAPPKIL